LKESFDMKFFVIRNKRLEEFDKRMELLNRSPKNDFDGMKKIFQSSG